MASKTLLKVPFPVGATVGAYRRMSELRRNGEPIAAVVDTSTVSAANTLTFDGLSDEPTDYWAAADVGGSWQWVAFRTDGDDPTVSYYATRDEIVSKFGGTIEVSPDGPSTAFRVRTASPFGTFDRFLVENNQDTLPVDINFRNCTVDFGAKDFSVSNVGIARFIQPGSGDGGYSPTNLIQVFKPGTNTQKVYYVGPQGDQHILCVGLATKAFTIGADAAANKVFEIHQTGEMRWGAGGASATDVTFARSGAAAMTLTADLNVNGSFRMTDFGGSLGLFNATPVGKQTVTGSHGGNAALQDLLAKLANYGLITDTTTA